MNTANLVLIEASRLGWKVRTDGVLLRPSGEVAFTTEFNRRKRSGRVIRIKGVKWRKYFYVHRLQAYQKFGDEILNKGVQVRHLNNNSLDNSLTNIGIGSQSENMMDIPRKKRVKTARIAAAKLRSLSVEDAQELINDRSAGAQYKELMKKYNVSKGTVSYIVNGKTYPELRRLTSQ